MHAEVTVSCARFSTSAVGPASTEYRTKDRSIYLSGWTSSPNELLGDQYGENWNHIWKLDGESSAFLQRFTD